MSKTWKRVGKKSTIRQGQVSNKFERFNCPHCDNLIKVGANCDVCPNCGLEI